MKILFVTTLKPMYKDFYNEQYNSILSWKKLRLKPTIIVFGNDEGVPEFCKKHDIINMGIKCNCKNVPYISEILKEGYKFMGDKYDYITYINADILLTDDFSDTIEEFHRNFEHVNSCLLTGIRTNLHDFKMLNFNDRYWKNIRVEWIFCFIRMTIIARSSKNIFYFFRCNDFCCNHSSGSINRYEG